MGRKNNEIVKTTEETVLELASLGATNVEIGEFLGLHERSVRRNYAEFLTKGRATMKNRLRLKQIEVAEAGNVTMLIWLGKQYLGQKDVVDEIDGDRRLQVIIRKVSYKELVIKSTKTKSSAR